ncbi:MAG: aminomethyl-transferring glycine dehydrogenase subunit GcvPA [Erysipelotrichaceae bacterium]|nr:aminomethyl-transferring glycine dehydrogenase subunit GcvPA [Erysipelotrichaceae bacterium]
MGRYIPETVSEQEAMLKDIGYTSIDDLYSMVPEQVKLKDLNIPEGKSELEVLEQMKEIAEQNIVFRSIFRGAGVYAHHIPSIVKTITSKEEFVTAYTPYQAEISQGVLQSIFEYQTQICELTGLDVSNASVYDGAVAAAEAIFMTLERNKDEILVSDTIDPETLAVIKTYCESRSVKVTLLKNRNHLTDLEEVKKNLNERTAGLYIESPNYFGLVEDVEAFAGLMHENKAKIIEGCDPVSLAIYKAPGEMGVDVAVGEGQQLGLPMGFGGPYLGFMSCKKELMRKLPGRIVGETTDHEGRRAYVLTLQAREQHIRREKASSNICSNEALCAMTASVYLAAMGPEGMKKLALSCYSNAHYLAEKLNEAGFRRIDEGEFFDEFLTVSPVDPKLLEEKLAEKKILSGLPLDEGILWCATELNTKDKIDELIAAIREVM